MRSMENYFAKVLKAPLHNHVWSWGAVGEDGAVYLRCWQDEVIRRDGKTLVMVLHDQDAASNGATERKSHLEKVAGGAPCFAVICVAKDPKASPRKIVSYREDLWRLGSDTILIKGAEYLPVITPNERN
jgi:hypothetical protein